ncbi:hypothetical protein BLX24_22550 [Arsenicibacter rosenii]|uniref:Outer membrane protein beta-barrel domain-containing protein n=2 Tax=Arsenicibacter rosenii TaxID=1750698 RepID=A0A1S2VE12_9BACT|nr:hypothetical protein BLX24_22550 [Arsenicibacter rosenii]
MLYARQPAKTVTGQVQDATGKPLELATVRLQRAADSTLVKGAITDAAGKYLIEQVADGTYRVVVTQVGYRRAVSAVFTLTAGEGGAVPVLVMAEDTRMLTEVKVAAKKPFIEQLPDKTVINVENSITSAGGTALEVLEKSPGVVYDSQNDQLKLKGRDGVLVMIDGKPTYLSAADVMNLLRNTPANSVQSIELITKPSAKYDAAGNSGIINIRLKRNNTTNGTNGSLLLGAGYGRFGKGSAGLTLNHRNGPWSLFGNYNYDYRKTYSSVDALREFGTGDHRQTVRNLGYRPGQSNNQTVKAGIDFSPSKQTTLGLMLNGQFNANRAQIDNQNLVYNNAMVQQSLVTLVNASTRKMGRMAVNANVRHSFDQPDREGGPRELTFDADYSQVAISPTDNMTTRRFRTNGDETGTALLQRNIPPSEVVIRAAKLDYVHPFGKTGKLEAGWKSSYVTSDNDVLFETLTDGKWVPDAARTNHFVYDETIHAAYINGSRDWKKWGLQAGLRMEHTQSKGNSITMNKVVERTYTNLFPSLFLTRSLNENNQLRFAYSRRIDRPNYLTLNPFVYVMDPYTYNEGNPFLRPQYTNAFDVGYTYKQEASITLSYNRTSDVISQVNEQVGEVLKQTTINLSVLNNYNLSISFPLTITKWWNMRQSADVFVNQYNAVYLGKPLNNKGIAANLNMSHNLMLPHGITAEVVAFYRSPFIDGMFQGKGTGQLSVGLQKSFWEKKASLKLNVSDVLKTGQFGGYVNNPDVYIRFTSRWETRVARLTFTYNLGKRDLKGIRQRRTSLEDEQRRVN